MFRKYVRWVYQRWIWEKITQDFKQPEQDLNNNKDKPKTSFFKKIVDPNQLDTATFFKFLVTFELSGPKPKG